MYARVTSFQAKPDTIDAMESRLSGIADKVSALPGMVSCVTVWNADGAGQVTALYESEAAANDASAAIQSVWGGLMDLLSGAPEVVTYQSAQKLA